MTKRAETVADIDSTAQLAPPKNALFRRPRPAMPCRPENIARPLSSGPRCLTEISCPVCFVPMEEFRCVAT